MTTGKDSIIEALRLGNLKYWKLRNIAGTNLIASSAEDESATIEGSIALFEKWIDLTGPGQYSLEAWEVKGQTKERKKINFEIPAGSATGPAGIGAITIPAGISPEDVQTRIDKAMSDYKTELRLKELEGKIRVLETEKKELEDQVNSAGNRIMEKLGPHLGPIMAGLGLSVPQASVATIGNAGDGDELDKRLEQALENWMKEESGETIVKLVENIAKLASNNRQTYDMAKGMLANQI